MRTLGCAPAKTFSRPSITTDRLVVRDKKLFWTLVRRAKSPRTCWHEAGAQHQVEVGRRSAHSGRKITAATLKEIQKAKIGEIEIDMTDLEGVGGGDIVDTTTGEVLLEATRKSRPTRYPRFSNRAWSNSACSSPSATTWAR